LCESRYLIQREYGRRQAELFWQPQADPAQDHCGNAPGARQLSIGIQRSAEEVEGQDVSKYWRDFCWVERRKAYSRLAGFCDSWRAVPTKVVALNARLSPTMCFAAQIRA